MTGMKQGAGEDPFTEEFNSEEPETGSETNDATMATNTDSEENDEAESERDMRQQSM